MIGTHNLLPASLLLYGQDSSFGKAFDYRPKGNGFDLALTTKGTQLQQRRASPCELISVDLIAHFF
jgi:hypothetical protein